MRSKAVVWILLLWFAAPADAVDGVVEIHQSCVASGCFSGDTAGFPVQIDGTAGRSYRLTSDLTVADENTTALFISAERVTVDLNGFSIVGVTTCSSSPSSCSPTGSGTGINSFAIATTVTNGTVRGMGLHGVLLGIYSRVDGVRALQNGDRGISIGSNGIVSNSVAVGNGGPGLLGDRSLFRHNLSSGNGGAGIETTLGTVIGNNVTANDGLGLTGTTPAYGGNVFDDNNNGNANPQVSGGLEIDSNVCGGDLVCP